MGRGPGNTKSEEIVKSFKKNFEYSYFDNFKKYINNFLCPVKKNINGEQILIIRLQQNSKYIPLMCNYY